MDFSGPDYSKCPLKREALDLLLSLSKEHIEKMPEPFLYITFGEKEILDVYNLMKVTYFNDVRKIISYEDNPDKAEISKSCLIYEIFSTWSRESKISVVNKRFPKDVKIDLKNYTKFPKIYYLDYTGWFPTEYDCISILLTNKLLKSGDLLFITSCLEPTFYSGWSETATKPNVLKQFLRQSCGRVKTVDDQTLVDNIVEIFMSRVMKQYNADDNSRSGGKYQISIDLIGKIKYCDTTIMGLWGYVIKEGEFNNIPLPVNFTKELTEESKPEGGLFSDMF